MAPTSRFFQMWSLKIFTIPIPIWGWYKKKDDNRECDFAFLRDEVWYHIRQQLSFTSLCLFKLQDYVLYMPEICDLGADSTGAFFGEATMIKIRECPITSIEYSEEM